MAMTTYLVNAITTMVLGSLRNQDEPPGHL
jgi:hypothetical protein